LEAKLAPQTDVNRSLQVKTDRLLLEMLRDEAKCETVPPTMYATDACCWSVASPGSAPSIQTSSGM
jgi:hypothetical protein